MIPSNNLSVLPFYTSIEQQNARKWWLYGKVYPLFTPAGFLLPFQLMRESRIEEIRTRLQVEETDGGYLANDGTWRQDVTSGLLVASYADIPTANLYLENIPAAYSAGVMAVAYGETTSQVLGTFNPIQSGTYTGVWQLPMGTKMVRVQVQNTSESASFGAVDTYFVHAKPLESLMFYTKDGVLIGDYSDRISEMGFAIKQFQDFGCDVIVFAGQLPILTQLDNGQYYVVLGDGIQTWYSEVFTVVNDMSGYLKLEWWDVEDFVMDAGTIVYTQPMFKNVLYLCSDIAKPEYDFDEEIIERDGYTFPVKQVSEKRYRFSFLASEYLLDVLRFVRMADYARITKNGQTWYNLDTFLISPEWEDNGDVAVVDAEFTTGTVAKKNGHGRIKPTGAGDFNDDFNNDFNNQNS